MNYIIVGNTMVNDLLYSDKRLIKQILGGGVYCVSGLLPWTKDILYVSGVGPDFEVWYGDYFKDNQLSLQGLKYSLPKTNYNIVEYEADGQWREYSIYSETYFEDHKKDISIDVKDFIHLLTPHSKGLYTEARTHEAFWDDLGQIRKQFPQLKIMWEIPTEDALEPERKALTRQNIANCDQFSINLPEAKALFNLETELDCIKTLLQFKKPAFFRVGERGAYLINDGKVLFLGSVGASKAIDPTGCGNISTATVMYALCEGHSMEQSLTMANVTAYYNTRQYGPKTVYSEQELQDIQDLIEEYQPQCQYIDIEAQ